MHAFRYAPWEIDIEGAREEELIKEEKWEKNKCSHKQCVIQFVTVFCTCTICETRSADLVCLSPSSSKSNCTNAGDDNAWCIPLKGKSHTKGNLFVPTFHFMTVTFLLNTGFPFIIWSFRNFCSLFLCYNLTVCNLCSFSLTMRVQIVYKRWTNPLWCHQHHSASYSTEEWSQTIRELWEGRTPF